MKTNGHIVAVVKSFHLERKLCFSFAEEKHWKMEKRKGMNNERKTGKTLSA